MDPNQTTSTLSADGPPHAAAVDHLVVLAADLAQGIAWCEATLGVAPDAGGKHPLMGTHNRLLNIASAAFPAAYLEVIAIDSEAHPAGSTSARRWFDMDSAVLQAQVSEHGPRLIHFVARVPDIDAAVASLTALGIDRGAAVEASRATPAGLLRWRISVRGDGQRLFDGALPTLIEWGAHAHPAASLPERGIALRGLALRHPDAAALDAACRAIGLPRTIAIAAGPARLTATLDTPNGPIELCSA